MRRLSLLQKPYHTTNTLPSLNSTHPNLQLNLELTYTEPRLPLTISGVSACTAAAISAARLAGLSNKLPRLGYKTIEDDVGVEVWPFDQAYTWGLMAVTVERVRDELRTRGLDGCRWQVRRVEGGFVGQVLGRGHMWPTLKIVGGEEKETAGA